MTEQLTHMVLVEALRILVVAYGIQITPRPLYWEHGVLPIRPPGTSLTYILGKFSPIVPLMSLEQKKKIFFGSSIQIRFINCIRFLHLFSFLYGGVVFQSLSFMTLMFEKQVSFFVECPQLQFLLTLSHDWISFLARIPPGCCVSITSSFVHLTRKHMFIVLPCSANFDHLVKALSI